VAVAVAVDTAAEVAVAVVDTAAAAGVGAAAATAVVVVAVVAAAEVAAAIATNPNRSTASGPAERRTSLRRAFSPSHKEVSQVEISSDSVFGVVTAAGLGSAGDPAAIVRQTPHEPHKISFLLKLTNLVAIIVPFAGLILGIVMLWGWGFSWIHLGILVGMYFATGFGITVGYHRLFTHKSFETSRFMKAPLRSSVPWPLKAQSSNGPPSTAATTSTPTITMIPIPPTSMARASRE
jgi:hypothetical protein